jgi:hypothetical protein
MNVKLNVCFYIPLVHELVLFCTDRTALVLLSLEVADQQYALCECCLIPKKMYGSYSLYVALCICVCVLACVHACVTFIKSFTALSASGLQTPKALGNTAPLLG